MTSCLTGVYETMFDAAVMHVTAARDQDHASNIKTRCPLCPRRPPRPPDQEHDSHHQRDLDSAHGDWRPWRSLEIDGESRRLRKIYEEEVDGPQRVAQQPIADARFKVYGTSIYPDATFTLRLSSGAVSGWNEAGTRGPTSD